MTPKQQQDAIAHIKECLTHFTSPQGRLELEKALAILESVDDQHITPPGTQLLYIPKQEGTTGTITTQHGMDPDAVEDKEYQTTKLIMGELKCDWCDQPIETGDIYIIKPGAKYCTEECTDEASTD